MDLSMFAPVIETQGLRLRARTLEDFAFFRDMWADPQVTRYIDGEPRSEEDTWTKFLRMIGHWAALGYGYWAVEEKASGRLVGEAGFGDFRRVVEPSLKGTPEMGWAFTSSVHGKGYATEAVRVAAEWGDVLFKGGRTACIIGMGNAPSVRVAEKAGFIRAGTAQYHGEEVMLFYRG